MDVVGAIRTYLLADAATNAATGGRIYGGSLPSEDSPNMPRAAIVLRRSGGGIMGRGQNYSDKRIDIDCYGATDKEASDVYDAAYAALKALRRQVVDTVLLHWAAVSADGASGNDPQTGWPVCLGTFQVLAAEVPA